MALVTANQFQLSPDLNSIISGVQQGQQIRGQFDARQLAQQQAQQAAQSQQFAGQALTGDKEALSGLAAVDPQQAIQIQSFLANQSEADRAEGLRENEVLTRTALGALSLPPEQRRNFLTVEREKFAAAGRDTTNIDNALAGDNNALNQALTLQAQQGQTIADLAARQFAAAPKQVPKQAGKGGLVFDPNTGSFSLDPVAAQRFDQLATKAKGQGGLDFKDRQGLNKDVTSMIKSTVDVRNTANDLEKLGKINSGPASIALVFKFMKALDPTSVVREGEFALAEQSAGIPESVLNIYNKLVQGERLGDVQINQFIETAKSLSNSATESSRSEVTSLLDTFEDTIPESFKSKLIGRIPGSFNIADKPPASIARPSGATAQPVGPGAPAQATVDFSGQSNEQLMSF